MPCSFSTQDALGSAHGLNLAIPGDRQANGCSGSSQCPVRSTRWRSISTADRWAVNTLGIVMATMLVLARNAVLVSAALVLARIGRRRPTLSLVIAAAILLNAVLFHILPAVIQHRVSPGLHVTSLRATSWACAGAWRDGVPKRAVAAGLVIGTF